MKDKLLLCPQCGVGLLSINGIIRCGNCGRDFGSVHNGIIVFNNAEDKAGFFDRQAAIRLAGYYLNYTCDDYADALSRRELYNMDIPNKKVGITRKLWWEEYTGKIENSSILEVGCGVNYIVPYWAESGNRVTAFDICRENVFLLKEVLQKTNLWNDHVELFAADVQDVRMSRKFDIININNVLHHIENKKETLERLREVLKDDGKVLIVEPNFYYPFRWIFETDFLSPINIIKKYFNKHNLTEKGEKAVIFSSFKKIIREAGFKIDVNIKDRNYLGYALIYFIDRFSILQKLIYLFDRYILSRIIPRLFAPFEYLILSRE